MIKIEEFLLARLREIEMKVEGSRFDTWYALRPLFEDQRRIIEWHKNWPVLVETPLEFETPDFNDFSSGIDTITFKASQKMAWMTQEEYRKRFGSEPPTAPLLKQMAMRYSNHPDWREEWRV